VALSILRLRSPRTEVLRDWAERIAARRGRMIAVVALARRMAGILYAMMRDAKSYQPARPRLAPRQQPPDRRRTNRRRITSNRFEGG
jgi:hypothetical protein